MKSLMAIMAMQYLNVPYKWGGNNTLGFDCSGLVLKVLNDVEITLPDMTSQQLYNWCIRKSKGQSSDFTCDSLLFFGDNVNAVSHVAISLGAINGKVYMIEAGGAGENSLSMSREELAQRDARVRIRPLSSRRDLVASIYLPH